MDESVPIEYDIEWAVRRLKYNRSGGTSRMMTENLHLWLWKDHKAEAAASEEAGD